MSFELFETTIRILDVDDLELLQREGTAIQDRLGAVTIHKRRLHNSSKVEYSDIPLPSSPNIAPLDQMENFITVPKYLISRQTLTFLGFSETGAATLWSRWIEQGFYYARQEDCGLESFERMFQACIHEAPLDAAEDDDDAWIAAMNSCNIGQELQHAIMDPQCKDVRLTESCKFWLKDTISARYASLRDIQVTSRERGQAAREKASSCNSRPQAPNH